jgi:predicted transcriptional regulator
MDLKKIVILFIISFLLFNLIIISPEPINMTNSAKAMRFTMDTDLGFSDASYIGENAGDLAGYGWETPGVAIAGDVNGDGFDDFIIGAELNADAGDGAGKAYLIFGKSSGWSMDQNLGTADATFLGENAGDAAGFCVAGAGDVNGDNYDDILISSIMNGENGFRTGQVYLVFGKPGVWSKNLNLSMADASFRGEGFSDYAGRRLAGGGDVNDDGFDDFLIGASSNDEFGSSAGQVYLILGKDSGWAMDTNLSDSDASFYGEFTGDSLGRGLACDGDVNGDGFDDILIGAQLNDESGTDAGQTYIIFGRKNGWVMDSNLSMANASFLGESSEDYSGLGVSFAGDVNNDGFDDILISAVYNDEAYDKAGQVYLIFGRATGWSRDISLLQSNASFHGENADDQLGGEANIACAGDVNVDGFDDLIISSISDENGKDKGQAYLILGRDTNWSMDTDIGGVDASFIGENVNDGARGVAVAGGGDINGDGFMDIIIGLAGNDEGGTDAGQIYMIFPYLGPGPDVIHSVKSYSDSEYSNPLNKTGVGETVFVELRGLDTNSAYVNSAAVNVSVVTAPNNSICLYLIETGKETGVFQGNFKISTKTHPSQRLINALPGQNISITSVIDPSKNQIIEVDVPLRLNPLIDKTIAVEDEYYSVHFFSNGYNQVTDWSMKTTASWLNWNDTSSTLYGTPDNEDIGIYLILINITDGEGHYDEHDYSITVKNAIPHITTENLKITLEDEYYSVDYNSSDDGQGYITWVLDTNARWLEIDALSGEVSGTPTNEEKGIFHVNVTVNDGNGGINWTDFELTVLDTNDAPMIVTENLTFAYEDELYYVEYYAIDIDDPAVFLWSLESNCSWLEINNQSGVLSGIPDNTDVGLYYVNVTVEDLRKGLGCQNFTLDVINVNDVPEWTSKPEDQELFAGEIFSFDVNATDIDKGETLRYNISSNPVTNISIDPVTGFIEFIANIDDLNVQNQIIEITLSVTDGEVTIKTTFNLSIILLQRPTTKLISPTNNSLVSIMDTEFIWLVNASENRSINYFIYITRDLSSIYDMMNSKRLTGNTINNSYNATDLEIGGKYYWTVVPLDDHQPGFCVDGYFVFEINTPPSISYVLPQKAIIGTKYTFELQGQDPNKIDQVNLIYTIKSGPEGLAIDPSTGLITWTPNDAQVGEHTIKILVSDGKDGSNVTFIIKVFSKQAGARYNDSFVITAAGLTIIFLAIGSFIGGTEVGKYKFLSVLFVPLYNKLHQDKVLDNYIRGQIHGYIKARPGEHYNAIKSALELKNGLLAHHLRILEKEGFVTSKRDGFYTRFYPKGLKIAEPDTIQRNLVHIIDTQPGITQRKIISILNSSQQSVSYHLIKLTRENILRTEANGRENKYFINYETADSYPTDDKLQYQDQVRYDNSGQPTTYNYVNGLNANAYKKSENIDKKND